MAALSDSLPRRSLLSATCLPSSCAAHVIRTPALLAPLHSKNLPGTHMHRWPHISYQEYRTNHVIRTPALLAPLHSIHCC